MPNLLRARRASTALAASILALAACGTAADTPDATPTAQASATADATQQPVSSADLAHAVVQISALDDAGTLVWTGSGTIISPEGMILTNAHVVLNDDGSAPARLEVGITDSSDTPPEPTYVAEAVATDWALDLAVVRITEAIDGGSSALPQDLPFVAIGDSDELEIGDEIRILGYPGIGGETITLTSGLVSGFVSEAGLGNRAWVKTDATIAGGNSGGLAANAAGEIIGVPTIASAGLDTDVVDCRPVRDTNRDGVIDDNDDCVPLGGFLNGLRPIALAADMLSAVERGTAYVPIAPPPASVAPGTLDDVFWYSPIFGNGVTDDDEPTGEAIGFATGTTSLCAFWEYEGMAPGMRWSAEWTKDGELQPDVSFTDETWSLDESGSFWVCADNESGFEAGTYDVAVIVEDEFIVGGFVIVGDDLATTTVTLRNTGTDTICYVYAAPYNATVWGPERIGGVDVIDPGGETTFELVGGDYDVRADDCDLEEMFVEPLDVTGLSAVTLEWDGTSLDVFADAPAPTGADLRAGDCFNGSVGFNRDSTDIVSCDAPHDYEIVGVIAYAASDAFPGDAAVSARAGDECPDLFEAYVGTPYLDSVFFMTQWSPSADTWADGDRLIVCALRDGNDEPIIGSMRGSGQ